MEGEDGEMRGGYRRGGEGRIEGEGKGGTRKEGRGGKRKGGEGKGGEKTP